MKILDNLDSHKRFNIALAGIILAGAIFRFRDLGTESLTADEASALLRLKFPSFGAMIEGGVKPDGHPAFAQVLLWFWTKIFGVSEFAVRFPFALMGTASIFLAAQIAKKLFNDMVCLCVAAGMSFLQFPLMYSQLARPYAPGMFFVLLSFFVLLDFSGEKRVSWKTIISLSLSLSLAAYSHYFAMLEAGLIAVAGFYFVKKENRLRLMYAIGIAILLFLPYTGIFLHQLKTGGVGGPGGWLGKPDVHFTWKHLRFAFDGSNGILLCVLALWGMSFLLFRKKPSKIQAGLFLLWMLPLIVGFIYSVKVNPVLQDSVLLFGFPFLLMFFFSWLPSLDWTNNFLKEKKLVPFIPTVFSLGLLYYVGQYKPYHLTDHFGRLKELVSESVDWQKQHNNYNTDVFYNVDAPYFVDYYYDRLGEKENNILGTINNGNMELMAFRKLLENSTADYFIYSWSTKDSPLEIPRIIGEYFPYLEKREYWFNSAIYVFSRSHPLSYLEQDDEILWRSVYYPSNIALLPEEKGDWKFAGNILVDYRDSIVPLRIDSARERIADTTHEPESPFIHDNTFGEAFTYAAGIDKRYVVMIDSLHQFGPTLKVKLGDIAQNPDNVLELDADIELTADNAIGQLVIQVNRGDSILYYMNRATNTQLDSAGKYQHVYFGFQLPDNLQKDDEVTFYIYSFSGKPILVRSLTARAMKGHEGIYGVRPDFE